jgi:hypothetical protein
MEIDNFLADFLAGLSSCPLTMNADMFYTLLVGYKPRNNSRFLNKVSRPVLRTVEIRNN